MHHDECWPGRPRLLPGESLSSWFARTAAANGLRPAELFRIMQPSSDRNPRDLDRYADDPLLYLLADHTGVERDAQIQAAFRHWGGTVFAHDDGLNKLPWLPSASQASGYFRSFFEYAAAMSANCISWGELGGLSRGRALRKAAHYVDVYISDGPA